MVAEEVESLIFFNIAIFPSQTYNYSTMHEPTEYTIKYVKQAAMARETKKSICEALGIAHETFQKYYKDIYAEARQLIPNLAANKVMEFLSADFEDFSEKGKKYMTREQAALAEKVMRSHGWARQFEIEDKRELPPINITIRDKDEPDE